MGRVQVTFVWTLSNSHTFHDRPQFMQMPKVTGTNSRKNIPGVPRSILVTANSLPGCKWCWYRGFKVSCGFVRSLRLRRDHTNRETELKMSNYNKIKCDICK